MRTLINQPNNNKMKILNTFAKATICLVVGTVMLPWASIAQKTQKLTDPQIASVAVTANQVDIDYAKIAQQKSKNADVLKFAETMAKDHQSVIDQAVALVTKLKVTPEDNATSKSLKEGEVKTAKMLNSKSGKAFDKAYIDNEVAYHKAVISVVENILINDASNPELKDLLVSAVPLFKAHLVHAEMVQKNFK